MRNTASAAERAWPNSRAKSRVRLNRCGWKAATRRLPGYACRAAARVATISVGWCA